MKKLKLLASVALVTLSFSGFQIQSLQAMDTMAISLIQPDGAKKAMKLNLDQPLSELRTMLIHKGISILPDDKFLTEMGELSPREEAQWKVREAVTGNILSFKARCSFTVCNADIQEKIALPMRLTIPPTAQGNEEIYRRFLGGVLIYGSDAWKVNLPIRDLENPLEGTFDLSQCGNFSKEFSISTGYRKVKKAENTGKLEIWFAPRFLIEKEIKTTAKHFKSIFGNRIFRKWKESAEVGIFWTLGDDDNLTSYDYLISQNMDQLSDEDLYEKCRAACKYRDGEFRRKVSGFDFLLNVFHVYFGH